MSAGKRTAITQKKQGGREGKGRMGEGRMRGDSERGSGSNNPIYF